MNEHKKLSYALLILFTDITLFLSPVYTAENDIFDPMERRDKADTKSVPTEEIYSKNDILYCTGKSEAALANNKAAELIQNGNFKEASEVLEDALKHAPLFFPFQYNLGMSLINLNQLQPALIHFTKASNIIPEYSKSYLQIGYIYDRWGKNETAMSYFKLARQKNPKELSALIMTGDLYYKRRQVTMAEKYYQSAIRINPHFPDGLLGIAKIHFYRGEYFKAIVQIKSIDISGDYDRSLHFYYAESAYKLKDYKTAFEQYKKLLEFRTDKFFRLNSTFLIQHKMNLSKRFIDQGM